MLIPRYWARGFFRWSQGKRRYEVARWGWSSLNTEDAQRRGELLASELAARLNSDDRPAHYHYGNHPVREEVIRTITGDEGNDLAVVTRNIYGSLVLNSGEAMFIDVDFPRESGAKSHGGLIGLFRRKVPPVSPDLAGLEQIRNWGARYPHLAIRTYRTFAGLRCLIINQVFDPTHPDTISLLNEIGSDPLYIRLCQAQACFRARLTPKPWRCGASRPPSRFPWASSDEESRYRRWQSNYDRASERFSVCRFVEQVGSAEAHPRIQPIMVLHDQFACARTEYPLA